MAEVLSRARFRMAVVRGLTVVFGIGTTGIPLYFCFLIVKALAGQKTIVAVGFGVKVAATVLVGGPLLGLLACFAKSIEQRKELRRLRERLEGFERAAGIPRPEA